MVSIFRKCVGVLILTAAVPALAGGDVEHGKKLVADHACAACHGDQFNNPVLPNYPKLAGQHPDYLEHALDGYKENTNPSIGRGNAIMDAQAAQLSYADIADIAAYLGSLPASVVTHK